VWWGEVWVIGLGKCGWALFGGGVGVGGGWGVGGGVGGGGGLGGVVQYIAKDCVEKHVIVGPT